MRVNYDDAGVTIVGYMTRRTLRWSEVQDATVGYSGFRLVLESGDEVRVSTIGKGLWSTVRKERNDLDDQVDRLREAIAAHDGHP